MGTYWAVYAGFILGILARALLGQNRSGVIGFVIPVAAGMAGALAFDYAGQFLGMYGPNQLGAFLAGVIGAIFALVGWRTVDRKRPILA